MSLNQILDSALGGLAAAQAGLRSVSNNIANAQTPGYARQRVSQTSMVTSGRTVGVAISEPSRIADRYLETTVYARGGDAGQKAIVASYQNRIQSVFGAPDAVSGFPARFSALIAAAAEMTGMSDPTEGVAKFTGTAEDAIVAIREANQEIGAFKGEVTSAITETVDRVNTLLREIHALNENIKKQAAQGTPATGLADQRQTALQELTGLVNVKVVNQSDGRVSVETVSGVVLLDNRLRQLDQPGMSATGDIAIRLVNSEGVVGAATGEVINSSNVGGKLGGLIEMRDKTLPKLSNELHAAFSSLAEALNSVSNAGTTIPAPNSLIGRSAGLVATDRLGFTGTATFAVVDAEGILVAKAPVDFDALGPAATVQDALDAINAGLGGAGTASMVGGVLTITATDPANGIAIAQGTPPSDRAGVGFSQFFGLNDMVRSETAPLVPIGFNATDAHGFGAGESVGMEVRDASGKVLARYALTGSVGTNVGDLLTELNASPLAAHGSFALDNRGRVRFTANPGSPDAAVSIVSDSTDRLGTGLSFSEWSGITSSASGLDDAGLSAAIAASPKSVPLARLDATVAVGEQAASKGDVRGANAFVQRLNSATDLGKDGTSTLLELTNRLVGNVGNETARARTAEATAAARFDDAVSRRDTFSGVNTEEELALMVVLQNSYSASARIVTVTTQMYDTLINLVR